MEAKLDRIRKQANSKLDNQKLYAQTLLAVEETIREQNEQLSPTAYFGAMMTTLHSSQESSELIGALLYLLDEVFPFLPQSVLRSKFTDIMAIIESIFEGHKDEQPIVRSIIGCLQELLAAQDGPNWSMPVTKKAHQQLLVLSANASPKARKRAQEAVRNILSRPPPPTVIHPAADMTAEFVLRVLQETSKSEQHAAQHMLVLLQTIVPYWPSYKFSSLCQTLLQLPKFNNIFLTKAAFDVFEALFDAQETDMDSDKFAGLLRAICELKPAAVDERLLPAWLLIVGKAFPAYAKMSPAQCARDLATVFGLIFNDLQQDSRCHRQIANCLCTLVEYCITDDLIEQASAGEQNSLTEIIQLLENGLGVHFQSAWIHVMTVQQAVFNKLNHFAAPLMNGCLALLGELRLSPSEAYKEQLDKTLGVAISTMGPEFFLNILPLNLESTSSSEIGRAFLLPLLKTYTTNTTLGYFVNVLIPLGDRLSQKGEAAAARELEMQAKVYETLVNQIWSLAPGFCDLPVDLTRAFNDAVAERFSSLLYTQPDLRPTIAQALQLLVEKNQALVKSSADDAHLLKAYGLTKAQAAQNLEFLSKFAVNYLAVFFNVYSQIAPMFRGFMADVIKAYLTITSPEDTNTTFKKVLGMLSQSLESGDSNQVSDPSLPPPMSHTMLDLAIIMIPFLDLESAELLYNGTVQSLLNKENDPSLQKKGYKVLYHLMTCPHGRQVISSSHMEELENHLLEATATCTPSAKKDRIKTLNQVVLLLPPTDLHFIPAVLSEVVLASKDNNEKTRNFAFELLVNMGNKMKEGGVVKNSRLEGFDASFPDANATISEFFTMVTAGLAGTTAHMISATVGALSRIFYEFKDDLSGEMAFELLQTINVLVGSNNREIVKGAIGYVKVCIVILDASIVQPQLGPIVQSLIKCQHQHKSHFKVKIRHLFERLIRRFGYEPVAALMPEEDKKMIVNIQKRRLRAKRKKTANATADDSDNEEDVSARAAAKKGAFQDAFEEVLYGSDSEIDDDSDDETLKTVKAAADALKQKKKKNQGVTPNTFIREDGEDGPLDFLDRSALGRISSSKPTQRKAKNNKDAFAENEEGRLVIDEPTAQKDDEESAEEEEDYYMQHVTNPDGFVRDKRNRIKFKKGKDAAEAMEVDDGEEPVKAKKPKKHFEKIGKEFRTKKAGGDVKRKGQVDPYSYIPLNKVIKKKGRRDQKMTYTGRVKK